MKWDRRFPWSPSKQDGKPLSGEKGCVQGAATDAVHCAIERCRGSGNEFGEWVDLRNHPVLRFPNCVPRILRPWLIYVTEWLHTQMEWKVSAGSTHSCHNHWRLPRLTLSRWGNWSSERLLELFPVTWPPSCEGRRFPVQCSCCHTRMVHNSLK